MLTKNVIVPELRRALAPPFAWVERRFLFDGFISHLSRTENLLYFFLVLAADRDGISFYSYDKICRLLELSCDDYIEARDGLIGKRLVAFDGRQFQVLTLPERNWSPESGNSRSPTSIQGWLALADVFAQLTQG